MRLLGAAVRGSRAAAGPWWSWMVVTGVILLGDLVTINEAITGKRDGAWDWALFVPLFSLAVLAYGFIAGVKLHDRFKEVPPHA